MLIFKGKVVLGSQPGPGSVAKTPRKWLVMVLMTITALLVFSARANDLMTQNGPTKVQVRQIGGQWKLLVDGRPFFIKGAGMEFGDYEQLATAGGNSFRTWRPSTGNETGRQLLDHAQKDGLYVTMGMDLATERHGFDYSDTNAVAQQFARMKSDVLEFKDHPALLLWDIGNELNLDTHNPRVWDAVNEISKMIHQLDPNHPTTTSLAGINEDLVKIIKERAPDLDFISVQSYADIVNLPVELQASGWVGPYAITEWGPTGHWECGLTTWGAPIEDNSSAKAKCYQQRYQKVIAVDPSHCLGSYVFLWGQKQERTPTWYGMFLASGEATEAVDVMEQLWTGAWPKDRCPELNGLWLANKTAADNVHLLTDHRYPAKVDVVSPSQSSMTYDWEIMEESSAKTIGGDHESTADAVLGSIPKNANAEVEIRAPSKPGAYRLYIYVLDAHRKAAYANIPFYVDEVQTAGISH